MRIIRTGMIWMNLYKYVSLISGVVQGIVTGLRGLCMGFGPAMYGFIFYIFGVEIVGDTDLLPGDSVQDTLANESQQPEDLVNK